MVHTDPEEFLRKADQDGIVETLREARGGVVAAAVTEGQGKAAKQMKITVCHIRMLSFRADTLHLVPHVVAFPSPEGQSADRSRRYIDFKRLFQRLRMNELLAVRPGRPSPARH